MAHLISDESIGGIIREYIEAEREVNVGDYVYLVNVEDIQEVSEASVDDINEQIEEGHIKALIPTNIVIIEGQRYRLDERKAEVGEKVLVIDADLSGGAYSLGDVFTANQRYAYEGEAVGIFTEGLGVGIRDYEYRVLIPAEPTPDIHDLLANLAQRVTSLERITGELVRAKSSVESQLNDAIRNIERQAQELEKEKEYRTSIYTKLSDLKDEVESNTKDIAFLDDRTQTKPAPLTEVMKLSVTRFNDGDTHVEVSYGGNPTPEEVASAVSKALGGGGQ